MQRVPSHLQSLHLLRALLREASYLPDANARLYFRRYIVNRFRAYQPQGNAPSTTPAKAVEKYLHRSPRRRNESIIAARTREMQRRGQRGLNFLRRAVMGEVPCLRRILMFTYGRIGRRKYTLLEGLLRPDTSHHEASLEPAPLQKMYYSNQRCLAFFDPPKTRGADYIIEISSKYSRLKAALTSQHRNRIALGRSIKYPYMKTPINNVWHRPMPIKRARNNVKRWYAETMTRLLPPLPNEEWDSIKATIDGTKWIDFVKPRAPGIVLNPIPEPADAQYEQLIDAALALNKPSKADRLPTTHRPRAITARDMRRVYSHILGYCSKLEWNEERNNWNAVWGAGFSGVKTQKLPAPVEEALFSGVDEQGKRITKKSCPDRPATDRPAADRPAAEKKPKRKHVKIPFYVDYLPPTHPLRIEVETFRSNAQPPVGATMGGELD